MKTMRIQRNQIIKTPIRASSFPPGFLAGTGIRIDPPPRWQRILAPVDFSLESMKTLAYASELAELLGASLGLVHVVTKPRVEEDYPPWSFLPGRQALMEAAHKKLLAVVKRKVSPHLKVNLSVRLGDPESEILAAARSFKADAILLDTEIKPGWRGLVHNTKIQLLTSGAPCPMLVIPRKILRRSGSSRPLVRPRHWRRILVPLEMTEVGEQALALGTALAHWCQAKITAFNVMPTGLSLSAPRSHPQCNLHRRHVLAMDQFRRWVWRHSRSIEPVETEVGLGKPAASFLQAALRQDAHLVVLGTKQFTGWRRLRAIHAYSRILGETSCPILFIPPSCKIPHPESSLSNLANLLPDGRQEKGASETKARARVMRLHFEKMPRQAPRGWIKKNRYWHEKTQAVDL